MIAPARAKEAPPKLADHAGLHVVAVERLSDRLVDVTFATKALAEPTHVRILLPKDYARTQGRYPVLYLLHGGIDDWRSWTDKGAAEKITAGLPLIVVMPDAGEDGFYTDWNNHGNGGPPMWETYHIGQLVPWIDFNLRTRSSREGRALAGLSMGGLGSFSYAARHPDLFISAASFSGVVDTNHPLTVGLVNALGAPDKSVYGPRPTSEVNWRGHNPRDLAANLRPLTLAMYGGNGRPHEGQTGLPLDPVEYSTYEMGVSMHRRLLDLGISHRWAEGLGQHQWGDWQSYLRSWLPAMMTVFDRPPAAPTTWTFSATEPRYDVFGWSVSIDREAMEFSTLRVTPDGFSVSGSGSATIATPARYRPNRTYTVWLSPENSPCAATRLRADRRGRLVVKVPLGVPNPDQQYTPAAQARGTSIYTTAMYLTKEGALCR